MKNLLYFSRSVLIGNETEEEMKGKNYNKFSKELAKQASDEIDKFQNENKKAHKLQ